MNQLHVNKQYYAHTPPVDSKNKPWELLELHLLNVANKTKAFAKTATQNNKIADIAFLTGFLHDLGKYRQEFQDYLAGKRESSLDTHHAAYGSVAAKLEYGILEAVFAIAGHHSGLHDAEYFEFDKYRADEEYSRLLELLKNSSENFSCFKLGSQIENTEELQAEVRVRMLFSCLVDADRLATAEYTEGKQERLIELRPEYLLEKLGKHVESLQNCKQSTLQKLRDNIFRSAIEKGGNKPGFFSMTVPTGGGKTLSSMAFALEHARKHKLRRIIIVIPYLSIIEQNAEVYRNVFGKSMVVEHHSAVAVADEDDKELSQAELATENWDAPIIVTTAVQFIETLFSNSPTRCRKLHNIARSVIVVDETQTLPAHLLDPTLSIFQELIKQYGSSILLCSATQPGFIKNIGLPEGLEPEQVIEIAPNPSELFRKLSRVSYHLPEKGVTISWESLALEVVKYEQVLVVVNTRKHAFKLWEAIRAEFNKKEEQLFHLSSAMCAEHRSDILDIVKKRLENSKPCYLVSTQLIEAGVDVDFPLVYRAMGPLDSIVQAAGRCNREGKVRKGDLYLFNPEDSGIPKGQYSIATNLAAIELGKSGMKDKMAIDPSVFTTYFSRLYSQLDTDYKRSGERSIQESRKKFNFKTVSKNARVIKDATVSIIVPYKKSKELIKEVRGKWRVSKYDLRSLQRFMVSVNERDFKKLEKLCSFTSISEEINIMVLEEHSYKKDLGVVIEYRPLEDFVQ